MASTVKEFGGRCIPSGYAFRPPGQGSADDSYQITVITMACATFCTNPRFRAPKWRGVRAFLFVSIGWSGAIPMTHAVQKWGRAQVDAQMGWNILFLEGLLYITGAIIYAVTIPYASGFATSLTRLGSHTRALETWYIRYLGQFSPTLSYVCCFWGNHASERYHHCFRLCS